MVPCVKETVVEKEKHKKRLEDGPQLTNNDIENYIERFIEKLGTEFEESLCEEMFRGAKYYLLKASATDEQIKEVEAAYEEHMARIDDQR